jgi:hypothetical protein
MARLNGNSILANFSGKIHNVVIAKWNGITYIRGLPSDIRPKKRTERQLINQERFKLANHLVTLFRPLFKVSIEQEIGQSASSSAMSAMLRHAITGEYPNLSLDHSRLLVARGSLPPATNARCESTEAGVLKFDWTDETNATSKMYEYYLNHAVLVAYCDGAVYFDLNGVNRSRLSGELKYPSLSGKKVHTWIFFRNDDFKLKSDSVYTGEVEVR